MPVGFFGGQLLVWGWGVGGLGCWIGLVWLGSGLLGKGG